MKTRPRELTILAILLISISASFPMQIMAIFGDTPLEPMSILNKLTPLNWAVMSLALIQAHLLFRASTWTWLVSPLFLIALVWNNWLVAELTPGISRAGVAVLTIAVGVLHGLLFCRNSLDVLSNPGKRWWLTPARHRLSVETRVIPVLGGEILTRTFDLSETGAFISFDEVSWGRSKPASLKNLQIGGYCKLRLKLNEMHSLSCTAEIVRKAAPSGRYPSGFGVRFVGLTPSERRTLSLYLRSASMVSVRNLETEDSYQSAA